MDWRDIPSLLALRAFEAAARTGTFSAAARELNVTHAAIAQHVRSIEHHLGTSLLNRAGRKMELTPPGAALAAQLSDGFNTIITGVRAVTEDAEARPLNVSVTPTFAENWLMPRLGGFWRDHPNIQLSISPSTDLVDLRRDGFDLGIRYGRGDWPGLSSEFLACGDFVVVASPELLGDKPRKTLSDLQDLPWLFETTNRESETWALTNGLDMACCQIKHLATGTMLLSAARAGAGVTVSTSAIVQRDIDAGILVAVMEVAREGLGYYLVTHSPVLSPRLKTFVKWLRQQSQAD